MRKWLSKWERIVADYMNLFMGFHVIIIPDINIAAYINDRKSNV